MNIVAICFLNFRVNIWGRVAQFTVIVLDFFIKVLYKYINRQREDKTLSRLRKSSIRCFRNTGGEVLTMLRVGSVSVLAFPVVFAVGKDLECLFICVAHPGAHQTVVFPFSHFGQDL